MKPSFIFYLFIYVIPLLQLYVIIYLDNVASLGNRAKWKWFWETWICGGNGAMLAIVLKDVKLPHDRCKEKLGYYKIT
jgi:hypothetical protein